MGCGASKSKSSRRVRSNPTSTHSLLASVNFNSSDGANSEAWASGGSASSGAGGSGGGGGGPGGGGGGGGGGLLFSSRGPPTAKEVSRTVGQWKTFLAGMEPMPEGLELDRVGSLRGVLFRLLRLAQRDPPEPGLVVGILETRPELERLVHALFNTIKRFHSDTHVLRLAVLATAALATLSPTFLVLAEQSGASAAALHSLYTRRARFVSSKSDTRKEFGEDAVTLLGMIGSVDRFSKVSHAGLESARHEALILPGLLSSVDESLPLMGLLRLYAFFLVLDPGMMLHSVKSVVDRTCILLKDSASLSSALIALVLQLLLLLQSYPTGLATLESRRTLIGSAASDAFTYHLYANARESEEICLLILRLIESLDLPPPPGVHPAIFSSPPPTDTTPSSSSVR